VTPPAQDRIIYNKSCGVPTPFVMRIVRTITDCTTSISKDYFTDFENCTCSVTLPELKDVLATDTPLRPIEVM